MGTLKRIGEAMSSGGLSEVFRQSHPENEHLSQLAGQVIETRSEFIEEVYPTLFGDEEMGDSAATFTPEELTGVLAAYESCLATKGLLQVAKSREK